MNILIINHYAGSPYYGMEFRPYYLAREWKRLGHKVTILGASFSHLRQNNPKIEHDFSEEEIDGINYVWFKTPEYCGAFGRIKNILSFVFKLQRSAKRVSELYHPNIVVASSTYPIDNYPAHRIAKFSGAKYAYEIHDLWPLSPMVIGGYSKFHPFVIAMQWGENYAYRHVDKVISLLWNAEQHCREHGLKEGKFECVPNGFNPEEWTKEALNQDLPPEHKFAFNELKGKTIVGFAGGFASSGALMTLVIAANELKFHDKIHFVLVGNGPEEDNLKKYIVIHQLNNITFLPSVPKKMVPAIIQRFDIAFMGGVHSILHQYGTSYNKLTDYLLSAKPIVQAIDEPGSIVERLGCGLRVEAENVSETVSAIIRIVSLTPEQREELGKKGRDYAVRNLEWKALAQKFLDAVME